MLWAEAKQMAALDTYAAEHKLKLQKFPLLDKCEEERCAVSLSLGGCYGRFGSNSSTLVAVQ
jgi:hypothetical protein